MKPTNKTIKIKPTCFYPSQWDDLIDNNKKVVATIYTQKEAAKDNLKIGITKAKNGIYDIVVYANEINNEVVKNALKDLEKITGKKYVFVSPKTSEDKIISLAEELMKPLKKYGNSDKGYDFTLAKTSKQKTEIINIWIGEILYEALTYKDVKAVVSLIKTIKTEIEELIS